jgi:hypothetical protein
MIRSRERWAVSTTFDEEPIGVAYGVKVEASEEEIIARGAISLKYAQAIVGLWNAHIALRNAMESGRPDMRGYDAVFEEGKDMSKRYVILVGEQRLAWGPSFPGKSQKAAIFEDKAGAERTAEGLASVSGGKLWTCVAEYRDAAPSGR